MHTKKIKVLFQLNELSFSGTTKAVITFCRHLDKNRFEPYVFCKGLPKNLRYYRLKLESLFSKKKRERFDEFYLVSRVREQEFKEVLGSDHLAFGNWQQFESFLNDVKPEIVHFSRGESVDWFTNQAAEIDPSISVVETSIFGKPPATNYTNRLNLIFMVSDWLKAQNPWGGQKCKAFYLPILKPAHQNNLRKKFQISDSDLIVGRISRPGLDQGIETLEIFNKIKTPCRLLFLGGGDALIEASKKDPRIIYLPTTTSNLELSEFYNSIDVLLHYRKEGETYGMSIADAMMHGKPVVSHRSFLDNAQAELISSGCGFVVKENDFEDHAAKIDLILADSELRASMGQAAKTRAQNLFSADVVTKKLENEYLKLRA
jgi:glycosyltransferase involved in cell wall biosynthesis